ncbi:hypothetical protein [Vibrio sp. R78045]|uniref:hypothetical protein n=1 Tax=Vibrio sp. R78045 TaxID=3093868 RepID=UPI0036F2EF75
MITTQEKAQLQNFLSVSAQQHIQMQGEVRVQWGREDKVIDGSLQSVQVMKDVVEHAPVAPMAKTLGMVVQSGKYSLEDVKTQVQELNEDEKDVMTNVINHLEMYL